MLFNKNIVLNKLNLLFSQLEEGSKTIVFFNKNTSTHPHYYLTFEFINSQYYKSVDSKSYSLEELRDQLHDINYSLIQEKTLKENLLFEILNILAKHINSSYLYRYIVNPFQDLEGTLDKLETTINICNGIDNGIESGGKSYKNWNSVVMPSLWACVYGGLIQEGLFISNTLENLIHKIKKYQPKNCVFLTVLDQPHLGRYLMSIYFAKALLYKQMGDLNKAKECYEKITQLYRGKGNSQYEVYWVNGLNRVTEAAIEVYKLDPTEENKNRAIDYYLSSCSYDDIEPTEATRERGLITYMLMTEILKIKVA